MIWFLAVLKRRVLLALRRVVTSLPILLLLPLTSHADVASISAVVSSSLQHIENTPADSASFDAELASLNLESLGGKRLSGEQFKSDKKIVLYFWSMYCKSCVTTLAEMQHDESIVASDKLAFISLHLFESENAVVSKFMKKMGITVETFNVARSIRDLFGVRVLPATIILDETGVLQARFDGESSFETLREFLSKN